MVAVGHLVKISLPLNLLCGALLTASMIVVVMSAPPPPAGCTNRALLLLSPCLPFISSPPNNLSQTVPSDCCDAFSSAYDSAGGICLCYFLREPQILGFPLNSTKLISLSSSCPRNGARYEDNRTLESLCSGLQTLPPLQSSTIPGIDQPNSPGSRPPSAPSVTITSPPPPPATEFEPPPPPPPSSGTPKAFSITKDRTGWFLLGILILIVR